jgi:hypothetical protein
MSVSTKSLRELFEARKSAMVSHVYRECRLQVLIRRRQEWLVRDDPSRIDAGDLVNRTLL